MVHCRTELYEIVHCRTELYGVVKCRTELYIMVRESQRNIRIQYIII